MSDKSYVTLEQKVCPACGRAFETGNLLLDQRMRKRFDRFTVTGFQICPDDQQKIDEGFLILVEVDRVKSDAMTPEGVYRTGNVAYLKKHVAEQVFPASAGHDMVWVESGVIDALKAQTQLSD